MSSTTPPAATNASGSVASASSATGSVASASYASGSVASVSSATATQVPHVVVNEKGESEYFCAVCGDKVEYFVWKFLETKKFCFKITCI